MKIWIHRYVLTPTTDKAKVREGVLLKVEWTRGQFGFSDLHPWPEFGEAQLAEHVLSLSNLNFTPLAESSLEFNYLDHDFRRYKRNAFLGLILPRSHRLVFDLEALTVEQLREWQHEGYSHIKVKMVRNLQAETDILLQTIYATPMLWRLDFNGRISGEQFHQWWNNLDATVRARIDFVEDPARDELKFVGPWADDWCRQARAQIRIVKPAREGEEDLGRYSRVIFTHSMEHSLGQAASLWVASRFYMRHPKRTEACGLAAPDIFASDEFSQHWSCPGPRMKPTTGPGFGFDEQLRSLPWERIL
jgi:O-succinylbenzoate synthase